MTGTATGPDGPFAHWTVPAASSHVLVCGRTGWGKTSATSYIFNAAVSGNVQVWLNDPKHIDPAGPRKPEETAP